MPGSIHISATQPPATPLFLQVAVGKREYSGNIERDDLSFPVTSLRESIIIMLYNADRELISKTELKTKTIVESGTTDVVFTPDSGEVILQLQFLLSDDDRKRIQEMRNSAMNRKQQEQLGNGHELNFPDSTLSKRLIEKISSIESTEDQTKIRKSTPIDDLQDKAMFSGINVDPRINASRDLLLQSGGGKIEDPNDSKKGHGKQESRSSSSVKKMISAFESTSSQSILSSETGASLPASDRTETSKVMVPSLDDKGSNYKSGKHVSFQLKPGHTGVPPNAYESRSRKPSSRDEARKQKVREQELSRSMKRPQAKHRRPSAPFSQVQLHSMGASRNYLQNPLNYLVAISSTWLHPHVCVTSASRELKDLLELEHLSSLTHIRYADESLRLGGEIVESTSEDQRVASTGSGGFPVLTGWLINQGVRAVIVVIACGAMFLNR